jgi:hypothetical protein
MVKVYIASKLANARHIIDQYRGPWLRDGIDVHARWLDQATIELSDLNIAESQPDMSIFWRVDEEDVRDADALIVFALPGDRLRGALVEAGIAIANGVLVIVVGAHPDFGTWQYHPGVVRAADMDHAKTMLLRRFRV